MITSIINWLCARRIKQQHIKIDPAHDFTESSFRRVLNTLRTNKTMVQKRADGIYIRFAGNEKLGEAFSVVWTKVISF